MNLLALVPVVHSAAILQTQDCEPSYKPSIVLILCIYYEMACCPCLQFLLSIIIKRNLL
jgi:hypothetical protein